MATVTLVWRDGGEATVTVDGGTVLAAAERAGVPLPFGCRTGACATCTGRLLAGDPDALVHVRPPRALKRRHLDDGYVLLCVATATDDCTVEVGTDVHRDLVGNPWRGDRP